MTQTTKQKKLDDYRKCLAATNRLIATGQMKPDRRAVEVVDMLCTRIEELS